MSPQKDGARALSSDRAYFVSSISPAYSAIPVSTLQITKPLFLFLHVSRSPATEFRKGCLLQEGQQSKRKRALACKDALDTRQSPNLTQSNGDAQLSLTAPKPSSRIGSARMVSELAAVFLPGSGQGVPCHRFKKDPVNAKSRLPLLPPFKNPLIPLKAPSASNIKRLMLFWAHNNAKVQDILQMDFKIF